MSLSGDEHQHGHRRPAAIARGCSLWRALQWTCHTHVIIDPSLQGLGSPFLGRHGRGPRLWQLLPNSCPSTEACWTLHGVSGLGECLCGPVGRSHSQWELDFARCGPALGCSYFSPCNDII